MYLPAGPLPRHSAQPVVIAHPEALIQLLAHRATIAQAGRGALLSVQLAPIARAAVPFLRRATQEVIIRVPERRLCQLAL